MGCVGVGCVCKRGVGVTVCRLVCVPMWGVRLGMLL